MINLSNKLWIHFLLIIAMLSLLMIGCNDVMRKTQLKPYQPNQSPRQQSDQAKQQPQRQL